MGLKPASAIRRRPRRSASLSCWREKGKDADLGPEAQGREEIIAPSATLHAAYRGKHLEPRLGGHLRAYPGIAVAGEHVGDFVADDRRQGIGILGDAEESGVNADVTPR